MPASINNNPVLVTAIVVCYNHARFVTECLENIRLQTYSPIQLVIIDDASTDGSQKVIRQWINRHAFDCLFIENPENKGICKNLNEALRHTKGKYVASISADDVWYTENLEQQVTLFESLSEDVGFIYCDADLIDENGHFRSRKFLSFNPPEGNIFQALQSSNWIPAPATLIRKACFDNVGVYDEELSYEDYDMFLRISQKYKVVYSSKILAKYRSVSTSLSHHLKNSDEYIKSNILIFLKVLRSVPENSADAKRIKERIFNFSKNLYQNGSAGKNDFFKKIFCAHLSFSIDWVCLCSLVGIPYEVTAFSNKLIKIALGRIADFKSTVIFSFGSEK